MRDIAYPLPVTVIANMLGVPPEDNPMFSAWSRDLAWSLELTEDPAIYDRASVAAGELSAYLRGIVADRRRNPQPDLITDLIAVEEAGDKLNEPEMVATLILLLVAGHETTVNLIGSGSLALLRHPDQFAKLKANPALAENAVEEMIRYDSPVQLTSRRVQADGVVIGGQAVPRNSMIALVLGAANRDPDEFPDPDTFDIAREGANKHVGFGSGVHFCLGSPLARVEAAIAFRLIAEQLPNLTLVAEPRYRGTYILRGPESLQVKVD